jgi:hypothetical protein
MATDPVLKLLNRLVGTWTTEATHPSVPGFPDSISIIGFTDRDRVDPALSIDPTAAGKPQLLMRYFDSRGVFRVYEVSIDDESWRLWRYATGFSQRFTGRFADGGNTIAGRWQACEDELHWNDDLEITYRR